MLNFSVSLIIINWLSRQSKTNAAALCHDSRSTALITVISGVDILPSQLVLLLLDACNVAPIMARKWPRRQAPVRHTSRHFRRSSMLVVVVVAVAHTQFNLFLLKLAYSTNYKLVNMRNSNLKPWVHTREVAYPGLPMCLRARGLSYAGSRLTRIAGEWDDKKWSWIEYRNGSRT